MLYKFIQSHCRIHDYLTEITICENPDCEVCRVKIGRDVRTPTTSDGAFRARVLGPMTRPVQNRKEPNHFYKPKEARKYMLDNNMSLDDLKKECPPLRSNPGTRDEWEKDKEKDKEHAFRGNIVRDRVMCDNCGFVRCIYSDKAVSEERPKELLQAWKEGGYTCGMVPTVKPYFMQRKLRCKDPVEQQYYGKWEDICALCCSDGGDDPLWTSAEVKSEKNMQGHDPLPLCGVCVQLKIEPPVKKGRTTNFVEKRRQSMAAKGKKRSEYEGKGMRKKQGLTKRKKGGRK